MGRSPAFCALQLHIRDLPAGPDLDAAERAVSSLVSDGRLTERDAQILNTMVGIARAPVFDVDDSDFIQGLTPEQRSRKQTMHDLLFGGT